MATATNNSNPIEKPPLESHKTQPQSQSCVNSVNSVAAG
jgi:hypothetical protein